MLNFASKMINNLIGVPGEDGQPGSGPQQQQSQQSMMMRNPQMGGPQPQRPMFQGGPPGPQAQQQRPGFPGQQRPPGPGGGPGFMGPRPPGGPGGRPPGPGGPGMGPGMGPGGPGMGPGGPGMGPQRFGGPGGPRGNGPRGPPGGGPNPRMMMQGPGGPQPRGPPGGGPRGGPMGPPPGNGGPGGRFYPPNRPPGQGPAGPQGQLRGPYPGSSPPGQQMRGPMMANNTGGGQQPRPPYFAAGGPTSNQGPGLRGPAGAAIRPGGFQQHQMMPGQHQPMIGGAGGSSIHQQQQLQQQSSSGVNSGSSSGVPGVFPDVDMSHLSEEERMLIESVMAKAQMEELELEQSVASKPQINSRMTKGQLARQISQPDPLERENELRYPIDPSGGSNGGINRRTSMSVTDMSNLAAINNQQQRLCSVCCRRDISGRDGPPGQSCAECRTVVCTTCGGYAASSYDNKNTVWLCRTCLDRRQNVNWSQQQQQSGMMNNQQSAMMKCSTMNDAGGHILMDHLGRQQPPQQQQQQTMREYNNVTSDHVTDLATRSATSSLMSPAATATTAMISVSSPDSHHPSTAAPAAPAAHSPLSSLALLHNRSASPAVAADRLASPHSQQQPELAAEQSDTWFKSVYQREAEEAEQDEMKEKSSLVLTRSPAEDGGRLAVSPVSYTSHRPFVDDSHRLRYQDIEDDEMHSNGSEENNHQGKDAEESDNDSLLEELATVAVKEGSDSDENLSDVEELNHCKDDAVVGGGSAAEAEASGDSSAASSPRSAPTSPSPGSPPSSCANITAALQHVYEHNPGEVYPIAEEEEEAASPTASDGVTSLRCRARLNSGSGIEGSALAMFNDQMTTANAQMRIGSPTSALYNRSTASSSTCSANQVAAPAAPGLLRGPHDPSASSLPPSNSSSNLMSHFGSSAIRFRSSAESSAAATTAANNFKDERMPLSPTATGMVSGVASSNQLLHHQQQIQQQQQQQYNNDMSGHDPMFNQQQLQQQQQQQQQSGAGKPAGTITGMLADFSRALGLGSNNASRSSPSDQAFGQQLTNDANHQQQQQQQPQHLQSAAGKMNGPQQQMQQQMLQPGGLNQQQQIQQSPNLYFTAADGSTNLLVNQGANPFAGQQQLLQGQQQQAMQSLQPQTGLAAQQLQTGNYASSVFPASALSQMDQQQQQMALQQQLQLQQQQQQLGQAVTNNPMMVNENTVGGQLFQQNKQLTQINSVSSNPQSLQQQQQQQTYGLVNATGTGGYVQQVAQQFEQSGVAAVIASQQPINPMTGMAEQHQPNLYGNQPQSSAYQIPGTAGPVGIDQQLHRPLAQQQSTLIQQQQAQQLMANHPQNHLMNDPANRMAMFNQQQQQQQQQQLQTAALAAGQAQQQQQQSIHQQQMMQQAAAQLQQQQSIIQQQQQQLLMMNHSSNQDFMQMQHQAQHSKKLRKIGTVHNSAMELQQQQQQQLMAANKMTPQAIRKNMLAQQQQQQAPSASLLHQSSIVPDPNKTSHGDLYGGSSSSMLRSADLLHKSRIRLIDGRPYSPTASPEIDMLGMRPGPAAHSFIIGGGGGTPITTPMGTPAGTPRGGAHSRDSRDLLACDSPDTLSETDSQASLRLRRKLPLLPPDQEAALLPSVQKKKLELAKSQQQQQQQLVSVQERIKAYSNLRQGSLTEANASSGVDRGYSSGASAASFSGLTRPTSETNLRQLAYGESMASSLAARPGSALGLLQGSSIVNANGLRSSINSNLTSANLSGGGVARSNPSISVKSEDQTLRESLAAILPPDLRHLVGAPSTNLVTTSSTTNDSSAILSVGGIRTAALEDLRGSPLTRRRALEEELQRLTEDRARLRNQTDKDRERELRIRRELEKFAALRDPMKRFDTQRRPGSAAAGLIGAQSSATSGVSSRLRKSRGHRRQLSDPRVSSLLRDREESSDRYSTARSQSMSRAKAYEYESMEELNMGVGMANKADWDRHRSIPTSYSGSALNRLLTEDDDFLSRKYSAVGSRRTHARRSSDGGMTMTDYLMDPSLVGLTGGGSSHHQSSQSRSRYANDPRMLTRGLSYDIADRSGMMLGGGHHGGHHGHNSGHSKSILLSRKPRSWHPSPYGSDEEFLDAEDDILTREAKKQRIKAEIARRRQQIEQNSRLHDELLRLSRLRESGDVSGYQTNHGLVGGKSSGGSYGGGNAARLAAAANNSSVLRSINDILREDRDFIHRSRSSSSGGQHLYQPDYAGGGHHHHVSPTRRPYHMSSAQHQYGSHSRGASPARGAVNYSGVPTEEERSMERLASTFRTEDYTSSLYERLHDFSPLASDPELGGGGGDMMMYNTGAGPTAMPLLPDMPSRSRKLLEDLAYASANDAPTMHIQSRGKYGGGGASGAHPHSTSRYLSPR